MSKNAMVGAITLCGVGLCTIGGGLMMQSGSAAHAGSMPLAATAAIAAATHTQAGPTVVWYGVSSPSAFNGGSFPGVLFRAWSDGTTEGRLFNPINRGWCGLSDPCQAWTVFTSPNEGYRAAADINADEKVDAPDLAAVLSNWGDAPRVPFPPSDCPLNLINP